MSGSASVREGLRTPGAALGGGKNWRGQRGGCVSSLSQRRGFVWGAMAAYRTGMGLSGPAFRGRPLPRSACLEGGLLMPARRPGPAFLSLALDSRPEGHLFLPARPVLPSSSLDTLAWGPSMAACPPVPRPRL